jgi:hypothetical protein
MQTTKNLSNATNFNSPWPFRQKDSMKRKDARWLEDPNKFRIPFNVTHMGRTALVIERSEEATE